MNEEQLQLLRAARLSGQDEASAAVAAARAAAEEPEIAALLEAERADDLALRAALQSVEPPAGLADSLFTAMRAARGLAEPPAALRESVLTAVRRPAPAATRRAWLGWGLAAAASVAAGGFWWWRKAHAFTVEHLSDAIAALTKNGVTLSLMSMDPAVVSAWLVEKKAPRPDSLPAALDALPRKGCHVYDIEGRAVSLICLLLPGMRELHLFSTPSSELSDPPAPGQPAILRRHAGRTLAVWSRGATTHLMFADEPPAVIAPLLA